MTTSSAVDRVRFSRQLVLVEIGERGQAAIAATTARVPTAGFAGEVARAYAVRAGFTDVAEGPPCDVPAWVTTPAARELVSGAMAAVAAVRAAVR